MTGALLNLISFVWFPYHFDSCLNYVYTLCEQGLLTEAACARARCVWAEVGFRGGFWILPDDGEAMESAVVAGAKDGGGAAVPARVPSPQAGLSRGSRCKSRCIFAINLLFPYAAAFLVRLINLGSGLHRGTRLSLPLRRDESLTIP